MNTNLMTLLAIASNITVLSVRFRDADGKAMGKHYHYKTEDTSIIAGDMVVVNSPFGGPQVVEVVKVYGSEALDAESAISYTWIVQKVDMTKYNERLEKDAADAELVAKAQRVIKQQKALRAIKEALCADGVQCEELDRLVARLSGQ